MPVGLRRVVIGHQDGFFVPADDVQLGFVVQNAAGLRLAPGQAAVEAFRAVGRQRTVARRAPSGGAGAGTGEQQQPSVRAQADRGLADAVAVVRGEQRALFPAFAVVMGAVDLHGAEIILRQLGAGGGEDDRAVRQQNAVVGRVAGLDPRRDSREPRAAVVLRLAHPELVAAVAPGRKVDLGVQKFCEQQDDLALAVFQKNGVVAAIADVAADGVGVAPTFCARLESGDPVLGVTAHGVSVPLQKAAVPDGKQRAVRRHGQARHMIALPFVEPFHDPVPFDNSCIHAGSSSCNVRRSSAASIGASRRSKVKRPSGPSV